MSEEREIIKKTVQIELEVDTSTTNTGINPFQKMIFLAKAVDAWRIFPRLFIGVYIILLYNSVMWFMSLENPTTAQTSLISVITGLGLGWFMAYVNTGKKDQ